MPGLSVAWAVLAGDGTRDLGVDVQVDAGAGEQASVLTPPPSGVRGRGRFNQQLAVVAFEQDAEVGDQAPLRVGELHHTAPKPRAVAETDARGGQDSTLPGAAG